jgi:hypothetical protein
VDKPEVKVTEITGQKEHELVTQYLPRGVNLGNQNLERVTNMLISAIRSRGGRRFLLCWTGNKVPRGTDVLGRKIAWTQNGMVIDTQRAEIGTYDRLLEFGGESKKEQMMIVYLNPDL